MNEALWLLVGALAGAVASVAGFGIGSLLTPLFALTVSTKTAVALVALPHAAGTGLRLWMWRRHVDRGVLLGFGLASAAGGLAGALLHARFGSPALTLVFAGLLLLTGFLAVTGLGARLRITGKAAWAAGALSGAFGGLVGNQGGIRAGAMLGLGVPKEAFVATATAIALLVDAARVPVYLWAEGGEMAAHAWAIGVATAGVMLGTLVGGPLVRKIPARAFQRVVGALILLLGGWLAFHR